MVAAKAIYSASQVDIATVGCLLVFHATTGPAWFRLMQ